MIKINDIKISYQDKVLIDDSNLKLNKGQVTLIYGKSGCGKTSLLYLIGLFKRNNCQYYIDDLLVNDLSDEDLSKLKRSYIGYVFQDSVLFEHLNARENLKLYASLSGKEINEAAIVDLLSLVNLEKNILDQEIETLSGGERQRLAIACALSKEPELLILDEPTSALDRKNEKSLYLLLKKISTEKKIAVVMVSHSLEAHKYSDVIYEISNQKINLIKDSQTAIFNKQLNLQKIKPIDKKCLTKYIELYNQRNRNLIIISLFSMLLLVMGSFGGLLFLSNSKDKQKEEVTKLSENQIFLINEDRKIDQKLDIKIKQLYQNYGVKKIYPYNAIKIIINNSIYDAIPYFTENTIDSKISQYVDKSKTVFISNSLLNDQMNYLNLNKQIKTQGFVIKTDNEIIDIDLEFDTAGYLKNGVISEYLNNEDPGYIMMPYSMLQKYYDENNCCGYTIFFEDYEQMLKAIDGVKVDDILVDSSFQNIEVINAAINEINIHIILIAVVMIIILGLQYLFVQFWIYRNQNYELAILNINGLSKKNLQMMINKDYLMKLSAVYIISIIMIIVMIILKEMVLILYIISLICSIVFVSSFQLVVFYHLKNLNPIGIIRN